MGMWQFTPFSILYFGTLFIGLILSYMSWQMRSTRGAVEFSIQSLFTALWLFGVTFGLFNSSLEWKLIFIRFEFFGIAGSVTFWVLFVIRFGQLDRWMNRYLKVALFIIPVITCLQILFIENHTFFYKSFGIADREGFVVFVKQYNVGFYIWIATCYTYILGGHILLVRAAMLQPRKFRHQILPIAIMAILVVVSNLLYLSRITPIAPYDPTPVIVGLSGVVVLVLINRYKLFDLIPASRNLLFQNIQDGVMVLDKRDRIVEINPKMESILDQTKSAVLGVKLDHLFSELSHNLNEDTGESWRFREKAFDVKISPMKDDQGEEAGKLIVLHDITELVAKNTEIEEKASELNRQNKSLEELAAFKQGLTHMIAHDMKNPLNVIISMANNFRKKEDLEEIAQSGQLMLQMVNNMLDIQKFEETRMELKQAHNRLAVLVIEAKYQVELLLMAKSIEFINEVKDQSIYGDSDLIIRVLVNLYTNAIKYMPIGGKLTMLAAEVNGRIQISVTDTGQGISDELQEHIFDKFWQSDPKKFGMTTSNGLGLTFCKLAVMAHGGEIGVNSKEQKGSTFYFDLEKGDPEQVENTTLREEAPNAMDLNANDQELIRRITDRLKQVPIYKSSKIEELLKELDPDDSPGIGAWKHKVREASYSFDNRAFEELINV